MTAFIFAGDMLVMLFMVCVVTWVYWVMPKEKLDHAAGIPLQDEYTDKNSSINGSASEDE